MGEVPQAGRMGLVRASRVLGCVAGFLAVLTVVWREWVEIVLHVDPDGGSGAVEWGIVGVLAVVSAGCLVWARVEGRRLLTTGA
jgi:hypothetical protein